MIITSINYHYNYQLDTRAVGRDPPQAGECVVRTQAPAQLRYCTVCVKPGALYETIYDVDIEIFKLQ